MILLIFVVFDIDIYTYTFIYARIGGFEISTSMFVKILTWMAGYELCCSLSLISYHLSIPLFQVMYSLIILLIG